MCFGGFFCPSMLLVTENKPPQIKAEQHETESRHVCRIITLTFGGMNWAYRRLGFRKYSDFVKDCVYQACKRLKREPEIGRAHV